MISQGFHRGFTTAEKTELWDRWQPGESLKAIGRAFSKPSSSIYFQLAPHSGIRPAARRRSRLALTLSEREEISRGIAAAQSARSMARLLGRSPSTVSRELNPNGGYDRYRAALADEMAWARARRPKRCKLANNPRLRQAVASKLRLNWSPEQIAGWLKRWRRGDECNQVSHETIYRSLFVQTRGVLKKELLGHLRSKRTIRRSLRADPNGDRRGKSRISCQSGSGPRRLKIVRSLVIGKAISCPGQRTAISRPWSNAAIDLSRMKYSVGWTFGILRPCAAADEAESKERAPHTPNQRARRAALKFSLSARNPIEGS